MKYSQNDRVVLTAVNFYIMNKLSQHRTSVRKNPTDHHPDARRRPDVHDLNFELRIKATNHSLPLPNSLRIQKFSINSKSFTDLVEIWYDVS